MDDMDYKDGEVAVVEGDILDTPPDCFIVQQCNCTSTVAHGLSRHIALRFPHADVYSERRASSESSEQKGSSLAPRERWSEPGTIVLRVDADGKHGVICAFAQLGVGKPGAYHNAGFRRLGEDTPELRLSWFKRCLDRISKLVPRDSTVVFPYKIGCGLAGGDWDGAYLPAIQNFARDNSRQSALRVLIVRRKDLRDGNRV